MGINYKKCPKCASTNTVKIIYGYPSHELFMEAASGKVQLGGCWIIKGAPEYFCSECKNEWNREQAIEVAYSKIKLIKASVGGFFGGYYNVVIDLENLETAWNYLGAGIEEETIQKSIRVTTANKFIEGLKIVKLLNWKARYIEPEICDGTQWSIEIITDDRKISKHGDNKFPEEWDIFCKLIRDITKRAF